MTAAGARKMYAQMYSLCARCLVQRRRDCHQLAGFLSCEEDWSLIHGAPPSEAHDASLLWIEAFAAVMRSTQVRPRAEKIAPWTASTLESTCFEGAIFPAATPCRPLEGGGPLDYFVPANGFM